VLIDNIYELFCTAEEIGTHFLVRTCVNRLAGNGGHTVADEMDEVAIRGLHRIEVRDENGEPDEAVIEIRYRRLRVLPPIGKQKRYPALTLTVIHAQEQGAPKNRKKIEWKLLTNLSVTSRKDAIQKLEWYAMENRGVPQNPQIRLQSGRFKIADCWATGKSHCSLLHFELAHLLDDDA
jgi:hypothetical protein